MQVIAFVLIVSGLLLAPIVVTITKRCNGVPHVSPYLSIYDACRGVQEIEFYNTRLRPLLEARGVANLWNAGQWTLLVTKPEYLARILRNEHVIAKGGFYRKVPHSALASLFGENIIDCHGEIWKQFTAIMKPGIQRVQSIEPLKRASLKLISLFETYKSQVSPGHGVVINEPIECWALDVFGEGFLDVDLGCLDDSSAKAHQTLQRILRNLGGPLLLALPLLERICWVILPSRRRSFALVRELENVLLEQTDNLDPQDKPTQGEISEKLIYRLKRAHQAGQISDFHYRSNLKMMFFAGHENAKSALISTMWELAKAPHIQAALYEEIMQNPSSSAEELKSLPYLTSIIYETLRLYPPVSQLTNRIALEPFPLDDEITIPKGTWVGWSAYGVHTDPSIWGPCAREYRPERWGDDIGDINRAVRRRQNEGSYIAFNAFTRTCIGSEFALLQLRVVLKEIVCCLKWTRDPKYGLEMTSKAALEPQGCRLVFERRV